MSSAMQALKSSNQRGKAFSKKMGPFVEKTLNADLFDPSPRHRSWRKTARDFASQELAPQALTSDQKEFFNLKLFQKLGEMGLLGLMIDERFGGSGGDVRAMMGVHEELSRFDPGFCLAYTAHSVLCAYNIFKNANEKQKREFLPGLCRGLKIGAIAISEPDCGTDALAMTAQAVKKGDRYIINGRKMWITNGSPDDQNPCDICLLYAKSGAGLSSFVVERGFKGFSIGKRFKNKLGMRASSTAELIFENCEIPQSHRIGEESSGLLQLMKNLEVERLALSAVSLGIAGRSLEIMNRYASKRRAFGRNLRSFGQIQKYLAESYAEYQSARIYAYHSARQSHLAPNKNHRLDCDAVKLLSARAGKNIADRAIQVLGARGYMGEHTVERLWRDARLLEIGGGSLEALEKNIAKDLGKSFIGEA